MNLQNRMTLKAQEQPQLRDTEQEKKQVCSRSERRSIIKILKSSIKMVLGLDCFGFMARKAPESSKQPEAEDARKKKDAAEEAASREASREASENKGEKAEEKNKKGIGTGAPLVVPHFPSCSTPALI